MGRSRRPLRRRRRVPGSAAVRAPATERDPATPAQSANPRSTMTTDRTGAETTVTEQPGRFTITVDGQTVGVADFADRDGRRVFPHTEVDSAFQGRGLATILVGEALEA